MGQKRERIKYLEETLLAIASALGLEHSLQAEPATASMQRTHILAAIHRLLTPTQDIAPFVDLVDAEVDRIKGSPAPSGQDNNAIQTVEIAKLEDPPSPYDYLAREYEDPPAPYDYSRMQFTIAEIARELGVQTSDIDPAGTAFSAVEVATLVLDEIRKLSGRTGNEGEPEDSLAEAIAHWHAERDRLTADLTKIRALVSSIGIALNLGEWGPDGAEILAVAKDYEAARSLVLSRTRRGV